MAKQTILELFLTDLELFVKMQNTKEIVGSGKEKTPEVKFNDKLVGVWVAIGTSLQPAVE